MFAAGYYQGDDIVSAGSKSDAVGLVYVQHFDDLNMEAYVGYWNYGFSDLSATSYQDAQSILFGARWKF